MVFVKPNLLPDKGNKDIKHQIALLNIQSEPFFVDIIPEADAEYGDCFPNVERKVQREGGSAVYGWQFAEYAYMIEAEFHAIWQSPEGKIIDITPSADPEAKQILFVIDSNKKYEGVQTDNARLNTTTNELVDDMIEIDKAKFRFLNTGERANYVGEIPLTEGEWHNWNGLNNYAYTLEQMYFANGTIHSECFCNSGNTYNNCHRKVLKTFLPSI